MSNKAALLDALSQFAAKRPSLDFNDYGNVQNYRQESRAITRDLHHARELLQAVARSSITAEQILQASKSAFGGRLTITETDKGYKLNYCTGQYFPTEYRKAVSAICAASLWHYFREQCMPEPVYIHHGSATDHPMRTEATYNGMNAGDFLRNTCKKNFSRSVYQSYFR